MKKIGFAVVVVAVIAAGAFYFLLSPASVPPKGAPFKVTMHLWPGYHHSFSAREKPSSRLKASMLN